MGLHLKLYKQGYTSDYTHKAKAKNTFIWLHLNYMHKLKATPYVVRNMLHLKLYMQRYTTDYTNKALPKTIGTKTSPQTIHRRLHLNYRNRD